MNFMKKLGLLLLASACLGAGISRVQGRTCTADDLKAMGLTTGAQIVLGNTAATPYTSSMGSTSGTGMTWLDNNPKPFGTGVVPYNILPYNIQFTTWGCYHYYGGASQLFNVTNYGDTISLGCTGSGICGTNPNFGYRYGYLGSGSSFNTTEIKLTVEIPGDVLTTQANKLQFKDPSGNYVAVNLDKNFTVDVLTMPKNSRGDQITYQNTTFLIKFAGTPLNAWGFGNSSYPKNMPLIGSYIYSGTQGNDYRSYSAASLTYIFKASGGSYGPMKYGDAIRIAQPFLVDATQLLPAGTYNGTYYYGSFPYWTRTTDNNMIMLQVKTDANSANQIFYIASPTTAYKAGDTVCANDVICLLSSPLGTAGTAAYADPTNTTLKPIYLSDNGGEYSAFLWDTDPRKNTTWQSRVKNYNKFMIIPTTQYAHASTNYYVTVYGFPAMNWDELINVEWIKGAAQMDLQSIRDALNNIAFKTSKTGPELAKAVINALCSALAIATPTELSTVSELITTAKPLSFMSTYTTLLTELGKAILALQKLNSATALTAIGGALTDSDGLYAPLKVLNPMLPSAPKSAIDALFITAITNAFTKAIALATTTADCDTISGWITNADGLYAGKFADASNKLAAAKAAILAAQAGGVTPGAPTTGSFSEDVENLTNLFKTTPTTALRSDFSARALAWLKGATAQLVTTKDCTALKALFDQAKTKTYINQSTLAGYRKTFDARSAAITAATTATTKEGTIVSNLDKATTLTALNTAIKTALAITKPQTADFAAKVLAAFTKGIGLIQSQYAMVQSLSVQTRPDKIKLTTAFKDAKNGCNNLIISLAAAGKTSWIDQTGRKAIDSQLQSLKNQISKLEVNLKNKKLL